METLPKNQPNIAIFASGNGSNAQAIIDYAREKEFLTAIKYIISDQPDAYVLERGKSAGVATKVFLIEKEKHTNFTHAKVAQEKKIIEFCQSENLNWVVLAGYMRILSPEFLKNFWNENKGVHQVVNIHPSLLPEFPGRDGYGDAFKAEVPISGVTIHFVDQGIDTGPIIVQKQFQRNNDDTLETFKARGLNLEHTMYPSVVEKIAKNELLNEVNI